MIERQVIAAVSRKLRRLFTILCTVVAIAFAGGSAAASAATLDFPPAADYPFGSISSKAVRSFCHVAPCISAECGAIPGGDAPETILGSHFRGTGGPFAIMTVATGFSLIINDSNGEHDYTIGGDATLLFDSPSGGTIGFSSVAGAPLIGFSFPFTVMNSSDDDGFSYTYVIDFPHCSLTIQGRYR